MAERRYSVDPNRQASAAAVALDEEQVARNSEADVVVHNANVGENFKLHYDELFRQAKPVSFPLFDLPFQKNIQFTGREEQLTQISKYLSQQNTVALTSIAGLGGVGKTQLSIEYAYRCKNNYKVVWFLNGQNLDADYLRLAAQLKVYGENPKEIIERTKLKLQELGNYLLIIDDAENYDAIKTYLPQTGNNGHVLITTRHRLDWGKMLELGVFALEEGLAYFEKLTDFNEEELEAVIYLIDKLLGLLPLALTQAGAFIKQTGISVKEYIQFFETKLQELWGTEDKARDYSQTITVTWEITINRVKQKYPEAEELLRGMSCLAATPNSIDQIWLREILVEEQKRQTLLGELANYSMIERHQERNNFLVHALVQEVVFKKMSEEEQKRCLHKMIDVLRIIYPYKKHKKLKDFARQRNLLPHLESLLKHVSKLQQSSYLPVDNEELQKILDYEMEVDHLLPLLEYLSDEYSDIENFWKKKELLERELTIHEKHYGSEHHEVAVILNNLATAYIELSDEHKAKELLERALTIKEKDLVVNDADMASSLSNLASIYGKLGDSRKAKKFLKKVLAIEQNYYGNDSLEVAETTNNLAIIYANLGKLDKQKVLLERSLVIKEKLLGMDHPAVAVTLKNLAIACGDLNEVYKMKELLERALTINETHYGKESSKVAATLESLGSAYGALGDRLRQKKLLERALSINEKCFGYDHPDVVRTQSNLATVYAALDNGFEAKKLFERVLFVLKKHYGKNHPEVAMTLCNLANVYYQLNLFEKAKTYAESAYQIFLIHPDCGSLHPDTQRAKQNLKKINQLILKKSYSPITITTPSDIDNDKLIAIATTFFQQPPSADWQHQIQENQKKHEQKKTESQAEEIDWTAYSDEEIDEEGYISESPVPSDDEEEDTDLTTATPKPSM